MAAKRVWTGFVQDLAKRMTHRWDDDVMTPLGYEVRIRVEVEDGPDEGRLIDCAMTAGQARRFAARLMKVAEFTEKANRVEGFKEPYIDPFGRWAYRS